MKKAGLETKSGIIEIIKALVPAEVKHKIEIDGNKIVIVWQEKKQKAKEKSFAKKVLEVLSEPGKAEDF